MMLIIGICLILKKNCMHISLELNKIIFIQMFLIFNNVPVCMMKHLSEIFSSLGFFSAYIYVFVLFFTNTCIWFCFLVTVFHIELFDVIHFWKSRTVMFVVDFNIIFWIVTKFYWSISLLSNLSHYTCIIKHFFNRLWAKFFYDIYLYIILYFIFS